MDLLAFERADYTPTITGFRLDHRRPNGGACGPWCRALLASPPANGLVDGALVIRAGHARCSRSTPSAYDIAVKDASIALRDADARLVTAAFGSGR